MTEPSRDYIHIQNKHTDLIVRSILRDMDLTTVDTVKHQIQAFILLFGFILAKDLKNELIDFLEFLPTEVADSFAVTYLISQKFQNGLLESGESIK